MDRVLSLVVVFFTLALILYSIAVWGERCSKRLKAWHLTLLWIGLVFDLTATILVTVRTRAIKFNLHTINGAIALVLMIFLVIWATMVLSRKKEKLIASFYKVSLPIWVLWVISFFTGMLLSMHS